MENKTEWVELQSDGKPMKAFVARPQRADKSPGVMVLQEAFGVNKHIQEVTSRISSLGYVAIAPELFHRTAPGFQGSYTDFSTIMPHIEAITPEGLEQDLKAAHLWLGSDPQVDIARTAAIGFCMGGRAAYLANAILPLKAAVSFYGGRIAPDLLPRAKSQHAPILLFWGGQDKHIGPEQQRQVADALREAKKPFTDVVFSAADHGFFCDERASYNAFAARQSWALVTEFFKDCFGSEPKSVG